MSTIITTEMYDGKLCIVETLTYPSSGQTVKRIFDNPNNVVPFDIVWVPKK